MRARQILDLNQVVTNLATILLLKEFKSQKRETRQMKKWTSELSVSNKPLIVQTRSFELILLSPLEVKVTQMWWTKSRKKSRNISRRYQIRRPSLKFWQRSDVCGPTPPSGRSSWPRWCRSGPSAEPVVMNDIKVLMLILTPLLTSERFSQWSPVVLKLLENRGIGLE